MHSFGCEYSDYSTYEMKRNTVGEMQLLLTAAVVVYVRVCRRAAGDISWF